MKIFAILGKSGSGKSTLVRMVKGLLEIREVVAYTTRPKRDGEIDCVDYHFVSDEEFNIMKSDGMFASTVAYNVIDKEGNETTWKYGNSKKSIEVDEPILIATNPYEFEQLKRRYPGDVISIKIDTSLHERIRRSLGRDFMNEGKVIEVTRRMIRDEIDYSNVNTDYTVENDGNLIKALDNFANIIENANDGNIDDEICKSKGRILFYTGTMRSGKSAKLIEMIKSDKKNKECTFIALKPSKDTRDKGMIKSRNGSMAKCSIIHRDTNLMEMVQKAQLNFDRPINKIYIDEVQFLSVGQILGLYRLKKMYDIDIYCFGLLTSYNNTIFDSTQDIVKISNTVTKIPYTCEMCKRDVATHHLLKIDNRYVVDGEPEVVEIKQNMFTCVCLECYSKIIKRESGKNGKSKN